MPAQPAAAAVASSHEQHPVVVALPSEMDLTNASEVQDALARALESGTAVVVADAAETTFCDCAGVRALIHAHRRATAAGTELRVASATSPEVRRILGLTGAGQVLDTYPTLTAARDGPGRATGAQSRPAEALASPALRDHAVGADSGGGNGPMADVGSCEQSGAEFVPRREPARFCSALCRIAWNRRHVKQQVDRRPHWAHRCVPLRSGGEGEPAARSQDGEPARSAGRDQRGSVVGHTRGRHHGALPP